MEVDIFFFIKVLKKIIRICFNLTVIKILLIAI